MMHKKVGRSSIGRDAVSLSMPPRAGRVSLSARGMSSAGAASVSIGTPAGPAAAGGPWRCPPGTVVPPAQQLPATPASLGGGAVAESECERIEVMHLIVRF